MSRAALKWILALAALLIVGMSVVLTVRSRVAAGFRAHVEEALARTLDGQVSLGSFDVSLGRTITIKGSNLAVRHKGRTDVPPLISVREFTVAASYVALMRKHVTNVMMSGFVLTIPPRDVTNLESPRLPVTSLATEYVIDELHSADAQLVIVPRDRNKAPRTFDIHRLLLHSVAANRPMSYQAELTNPRPRGQIEAAGEFGAWNPIEPSLTPLRGDFTFAHANLGDFKGLAGTLSSHGTFGGVLERIDVTGETSTPDFTVTLAGNPLPLTTRYQAVVDGTNGDTWLKHVEASFLASSLVADGGVFSRRGKRGRTVSLRVTMKDAKVSDVLRLAIKGSASPLTGALSLKTTLVLPPGEEDVIDRLQLDGEFAIRRARFVRLDIQSKVDSLSRRARGQPEEVESEHVVSDLTGQFTLNNATADFSRLGFEVDGAKVALTGRYGLRQETLDFQGTVRLQARLSQTTTGMKSLLLKMIDPLFGRKNAGSVLPIKITGTRTNPSFGLDMMRAIRRSDP